MSIVSSPMKLVLILCNSLILLFAMVTVGFGLMVLLDAEFVTAWTEELQESLDSTLADAGVPLETPTVNLADFMLPAAYVAIVIGDVVFAFALLGYIAACTGIKILLIIYAIAVGGALFAEFLIGILAVTHKYLLDNEAKPHFLELLQNYTGIAGDDPITVGWNALMTLEKCCGVNNFTDFQDLPMWPPLSPPANLSGVDLHGYNLITPVVCCKDVSKDWQCAMNGTANTENNNMNNGCYDMLHNLIFNNDYIQAGAIYLMFFEVVLLSCAIWILCKAGGSENEGQVLI